MKFQVVAQCVLAVALCQLSVLSAMAAPPEGLDIHWIDVEGGAATLVVTPAGESILFDTGMPGLRDPVRINRECPGIVGVRWAGLPLL